MKIVFRVEGCIWREEMKIFSLVFLATGCRVVPNCVAVMECFRVFLTNYQDFDHKIREIQCDFSQLSIDEFN
jgi:hypothetical protein